MNRGSHWLWLGSIGALALAGAVTFLALGPGETRPTLILVVLDTVRADHTSLCGYPRPTTPQLEALRAEGFCTCDGVAPGSWTLPSHASFFTGRSVLDHGADFVSSGGVEAAWSRAIGIRPLDARLPTLAEKLAAEGYWTAGYSANAVIGPESGLTRGFGSFATCAVGSHCGGAEANREVRKLLAAAHERDAPLFLFVNYMDAHTPWAPVPSGVDWISPAPDADLPKGDLTVPFMRHQLPAPAADAFLARRRDAYDWGVHLADRSLRELLGLLAEDGRLARGYRLVVTSDHGELLGEHGLLDHGLSLHEENNRVPLCVADSKAPLPDLPVRVSAQIVHDLVLGRAPAPPRIESVSFPRRDFAALTGAGSELWTAHWEGSRKTVRHDGVVEAYDLGAPGEARLAPPPPGDAGRRYVEAMARAAEELFANDAGASGELQERLRALGYTK